MHSRKWHDVSILCFAYSEHVVTSYPENSFHHKVPDDLVPLTTKATHGLVSPEEFVLPSLSSLWTEDAYNAFTLTGVTFPDPSSKSKVRVPKDAPDSPAKDLPPVQEKAFTETTKDPKNESGCSIQ